VKSNALALIYDRSVSAYVGRFERVGSSACSLYRNPPLLHFASLQWKR